MSRKLENEINTFIPVWLIVGWRWSLRLTKKLTLHPTPPNLIPGKAGRTLTHRRFTRSRVLGFRLSTKTEGTLLVYLV